MKKSVKIEKVSSRKSIKPAPVAPEPAPAPEGTKDEKPAPKQKKASKKAKPAPASKKAERDAWNALASSRMAKINGVVIRSGKRGVLTKEVAEETGEETGLVTSQLVYQLKKGNCTRTEEKDANGKKCFRWFPVVK